MSELTLSDTQLERLREVCTDLEAAYVGPYGTVRPEEALEYLLDTYVPPEESDAAPDPEPATDPEAAVSGADAEADETEKGGTAEDETGDDETGEDNADAAADDSEGETDAEAGKARLQSMMSMLEDHADKWRDGAGDARYEVDLPDGETESARTKDDVRRILFQHYR